MKLNSASAIMCHIPGTLQNLLLLFNRGSVATSSVATPRGSVATPSVASSLQKYTGLLYFREKWYVNEELAMNVFIRTREHVMFRISYKAKGRDIVIE